jgi:hypothetical protein
MDRLVTAAVACALFVPSSIMAAPREGDPQKVLKAINVVSAEHRLPLAAQGLYELDGWRYGADLASTFKDVGMGIDPAQRKMLVLRGLMTPLAQIGCAHAVSQAMSVKPAQQGELVRASCPPGAPVFTAARVAGVAPELVMLAIVLEQRAQKGAFAREPLHRRVIDVLLEKR